MFAGGTAESLDEFNRRAQLDSQRLQSKEGARLVSRLRGAIEIGGINGLGNTRVVPRAIVLRRLLATRSDGLTDGQICQLLSNGQFVHGVRSMEALLDAQRTESGGLDLPDAFRQQHFSRGVLDGQLVGISAGLNEPASQAMFSALTTQLLQNGASLAYGGEFIPHGTLHQVVEAARLAPPELGADTAKPRPERVYNYLGFPASLKAQVRGRTRRREACRRVHRTPDAHPSELEELARRQTDGSRRCRSRKSVPTILGTTSPGRSACFECASGSCRILARLLCSAERTMAGAGAASLASPKKS